ncbi:hypothetical protein D3C72_1508690 [compost metagenome]
MPSRDKRTSPKRLISMPSKPACTTAAHRPTQNRAMPFWRGVQSKRKCVYSTHVVLSIICANVIRPKASTRPRISTRRTSFSRAANGLIRARVNGARGPGCSDSGTQK